MTPIGLLGSIPSPSANSISIGPLSLNAYGLMIALGVLAAIWLLGRQLESKGVGTTDDASSIGIWGVAAGIVGARLYHVATDWNRFADDLGSIPAIWKGGLGIPGGLLLGVAAGLWQGRRRGIPAGVLLTCAAPAIPLAQAIGRWGNWFNQELFGKPTDLPWGLEIDDAHTPAQYGSDTLFHPTFLYESLWNLGLVAVLLMIDRTGRLGPGRLFAVYLMGYGIGRFWIEGLRIDPVELDDVAGLRWNQWVALAAIVGGGIYLFATRGQRWPDDLGRVDDGEHDDGEGPDEADQAAHAGETATDEAGAVESPAADGDDPAGDDSAGGDSAGDDSDADEPAGDDSAGDDSDADEPAGDDSDGDDSDGDDSAGDDSAGDDPAGDDSDADEPAGDDSDGDDSAGDDSDADEPAGDDLRGDDSAGDDSAGGDSAGDAVAAADPSVDAPVADEAEADRSD